MNERLKQLAIESKLIAPEYNGFDHTRLSISQQKFAELIVREMLDIFDKRAEPGTGFYEPQEPAEMIREHFGVEE